MFGKIDTMQTCSSLKEVPIFVGYEAKSKLPVILPLPRDYTYDIAVEKCEEIGYQLCKKSQVCPDNIPVYGVVEGSISWIPIGDEINEWIRIGMLLFIKMVYK